MAEIAAQPGFTQEVIAAAILEKAWRAAGLDALAAAFVSGSRNGSARRTLVPQ
ncbi:hypothetical protein ILP97_50545 [Amycolatopsis sp. H6(2020)]|nr:hypothetical protein [Amycolatopsis sp. H6(2020)]